jgi:uncharacterized integral membrane protein
VLLCLAHVCCQDFTTGSEQCPNTGLVTTYLLYVLVITLNQRANGILCWSFQLPCLLVALGTIVMVCVLGIDRLGKDYRFGVEAVMMIFREQASRRYGIC